MDLFDESVSEWTCSAVDGLLVGHLSVQAKILIFSWVENHIGF
jgi:hypothetical protein